jgi:MFS family permease
VVLGCLVCQLGLGYGYVFGPLARDIISEFGWTRAQYSGARAPQLFVLAAMSPLVGVLTVRWGARPILILSSMLIGVCFFLFSQIQTLWHLYAVVLLLGLALAGVGDITVGQVVTQWIRRRRGLALGIVYTGSNLAGWLLVPIAVDIAERTDWRDALLQMSVAAFVVILPAALWLVRERRPPLIEPAVTMPADESGSGARAGAEGDLNLRQALRTRSFWILTATLFTFFFYFIGMLEHLVLFLTDQGMPLSDATFYFSTAIGFGLISKILLGALADLIPERASIVADYLLLALSSVVLLWLPDGRMIWVFLVSYGFATAARDVVYPLVINHCFGERYMAEIYGAMLLALMPGGALGPIFAAAIHDATGSYETAFGSFAVLNASAVGGLLLLRRERGRAGR